MAGRQGQIAIRIGLYILLATVMVYGVLFLYVALSRMGFPYELEWLEGSVLTQVQRIQAGLPVYTAPSLAYTPLVYTPLYFYVSAGTALLLGPGFLPLRLVSLLATLGVILVLFFLVWVETGNGLAAFLSAGLFVASYGLAETWFDLARVDLLFLFLLLLGVYSLRAGKGMGSAVLAAIWFTLSFLTKQTALFFVLPMIVFELIFGQRRRTLILAGAMVVLVGGTTLAFNALSGGWYGFYVFDLPRNHGFSLYFALSFLFKDLAPYYAPAGVLGLYYLLVELARPRAQRDYFYPFLLVVFWGGSWVARANLGGGSNTLLPAIASLGIIFGLAFAHLLQNKNLFPVRDAILRPAFLYLVCLLQFATLAYNPLAKIPSDQNRLGGDRLVAAIRAIPGNVFIPSHNYLTGLAGKPVYAHNIALAEAMGVFGNPANARYGADLTQTLAEVGRRKEFGAIILDGTDATILPDGPATGYHLQAYPELETGDEFFSVFPMKPKTRLKFYLPDGRTP